MKRSETERWAAEGIRPMETLPAPGDVLFADFLCGHTGSSNRSAEPRLMFQSRFGIASTLGRERHGGNCW